MGIIAKCFYCICCSSQLSCHKSANTVHKEHKWVTGSKWRTEGRNWLDSEIYNCCFPLFFFSCLFFSTCPASHFQHWTLLCSRRCCQFNKFVARHIDFFFKSPAATSEKNEPFKSSYASWEWGLVLSCRSFYLRSVQRHINERMWVDGFTLMESVHSEMERGKKK